jgi:hypothetical protein
MMFSQDFPIKTDQNAIELAMFQLFIACFPIETSLKPQVALAAVAPATGCARPVETLGIAIGSIGALSFFLWDLYIT